MAAELRMEEQKALEKEWARKKRPQDVSVWLVYRLWWYWKVEENPESGLG